MTNAEIDAYYDALWLGYREAFPDPPDEDYECCPDCNGEGAVLSDRPGYVQVCPTCRGEGDVLVPAS